MRQFESPSDTVSRRSFLTTIGTAASAGGLAGVAGSSADASGAGRAAGTPNSSAATNRVSADPTDIPDPIDRHGPSRHEVVLEAEEVTAEIEPGVTFDFMTFGGQVPGPMIRVRQGDTVTLSVQNLPENNLPHSVDLHAVYGTGGGAVATTAAPGSSAAMSFKAMYPGAYIYHCAVPNLDYHISSGMFGMILVEPPEGLPPVDHEFYLGQHEVYTDMNAGEKGRHAFDFEAMKAEDPTYVLLNGAKHGLTGSRYGAVKVQTGETARIFFVDGGPNLTSNFHAIGNVWTRAWREGSVRSSPEENVQTLAVPPGSTSITEMEFPVTSEIKLVDHALSRVARKGMLGVIEVSGEPVPEVFNPNPAQV